MRGRKRRRRAELGEIAWLTEEKQTELIMKISVSSLLICPRFPHSSSCFGGKSLLWGLIEPDKSLVSCHWLDSDHHHDVVGETKHASIRQHIKTNPRTIYQNTYTDKHAHTVFVFTFGTFSWGSTVIIWWFSAVIVRCTAPGGGCAAPHLKKRKRDRWYLPGWCVWPVRRTITPWHPVLGLNSVCQTLISVSSLKSLKTNKQDGMVKYSLQDCTLTLEASADFKAPCSWIVLAPVGITLTSKCHYEISLNIQTFWACSLLEFDKWAL